MNNCALKKNQNIIQKIFGKSLTSTKKDIIKPKTPLKPTKPKQINNSNYLSKLNTTREVFKNSEPLDNNSGINDLGNYAQKPQKDILKNIKNKNDIPKKSVIIKRNNINLRNKKMKDFYKEMQNDLNNYNNRKIINSNSVIARKNYKFTAGKINNPSTKRINDFHLSLSVDKYRRNNMNNSMNYHKEKTNKELRKSFDDPNYLKKNIINTKLKIRLNKNLPSDNQSSLLYSIINNNHKKNSTINKKNFDNNLQNASNINIYNSNVTYNNTNNNINGNNNNYTIPRASMDPFEKRRRIKTDINNNLMNLDKNNKTTAFVGYKTRKNFAEQKTNTKNQKIYDKIKNSQNSPKSVKIRKIRHSFLINSTINNKNNNKNNNKKLKIQKFNKIKTNNKIFLNNKNKNNRNCAKNKIPNNNSVKKIVRNNKHIISISDIDQDIIAKTFITENNNNKTVLNLDEINDVISDNNSIMHTDRTNSNKSDIFESGIIGTYNKEKLYEIFQVISDVKVKSFIEYEEDKKHKLQENNNNKTVGNNEDIDNNLNINEIITSNYKTIDDHNKFIEDRDEYNIVLKQNFSKDRFSFRPTNNDSNETLQDTFMRNANKSTILNKKDFLNNIENSFQKEKKENWIKKALNNYKAKKNVNHIKSTKNIAHNKMVKSISNDFKLKKNK